MAAPSFILDSKRISVIMRRLEKGGIAAIKKALIRTGFEMIDSEKIESARVFDYHGARGASVLSGRNAFSFEPATAGTLSIKFHPGPRGSRLSKTTSLLQDHVLRTPFTVTEGGRLGLGGEFLAIPTTGELGAPESGKTSRTARSGSGRVRKTPAQLYASGRAFTRRGQGGKKVLFEATGRRGRKTTSRSRSAPGKGRTGAQARFVLIPRAAGTKSDHRYYAVAHNTAKRVFHKKLRQEYHKAIRRKR